MISRQAVLALAANTYVSCWVDVAFAVALCSSRLKHGAAAGAACTKISRRKTVVSLQSGSIQEDRGERQLQEIIDFTRVPAPFAAQQHNGERGVY